MKTIAMGWAILLAGCLLFSCDKKDENKPISGPEIEWISGGTTTTYAYSSGALTGFFFHRSFKVLNESGEVTIHVQVKGDDDTRVSGTFQVEKDQEYALKVRGGISGTQVANPGATCLTVEFSSPNSKNTQEIKVYAYTVFGPVVDIDYCPISLNFQPITMNQ